MADTVLSSQVANWSGMRQLMMQMRKAFFAARAVRRGASGAFANEAFLAAAVVQLSERMGADNAPPPALALQELDHAAAGGVSLPFALFSVFVTDSLQFELEFDGVGGLRIDAARGVLCATLLEAKTSARKGAAGALSFRMRTTELTPRSAADAAKQILERGRMFAAVASVAAPLFPRLLMKSVQLPDWLPDSLLGWCPGWMVARVAAVDVRGSVVLVTPVSAQQREMLTRSYARKALCNRLGEWMGVLSVDFWTIQEGPPQS